MPNCHCMRVSAYCTGSQCGVAQQTAVATLLHAGRLKHHNFTRITFGIVLFAAIRCTSKLSAVVAGLGTLTSNERIVLLVNDRKVHFECTGSRSSVRVDRGKAQRSLRTGYANCATRACEAPPH
eukprot:4428433-Pleurochrysis_carterae.AAC.6